MGIPFAQSRVLTRAAAIGCQRTTGKHRQLAGKALTIRFRVQLVDNLASGNDAVAQAAAAELVILDEFRDIVNHAVDHRLWNSGEVLNRLNVGEYLGLVIAGQIEAARMQGDCSLFDANVGIAPVAVDVERLLGFARSDRSHWYRLLPSLFDEIIDQILKQNREIDHLFVTDSISSRFTRFGARYV